MGMSPSVRRSRCSRRSRRSRTARVAAALLTLTALAACGEQQSAEGAGAGGSSAPTTSFTEKGVTVTLSVSGWQASKGTLTAVFTPEEKGFHLYSTDLPATGIEGVGRPTAVSVTGALKAEGKLTAGAQVRSISVPGVGAPVPVYPDGPVTTTLPVRADGNGDATVLLGYASCSEKDGCTIPVSDRPVHLRITPDGPTFASH
ncbi:hypothetical protein [Streptomyces bambusae]|uniref:Thiol:disulfide interchange protein DsbD N-terminal domain-containing protein n=1 Tax=Streptomyces bambusae TaxID=1550616 RepID=A0ABS6ZD20_9ACTN|nr:hypothetical protein [Streptomyces bambusae]MBW5485657.1 hypothetical protein [Streptomyces bambusae]